MKAIIISDDKYEALVKLGIVESEDTQEQVVPERRTPNVGESYCTVSDMLCVEKYTWTNDSNDKRYFDAYNVFKDDTDASVEAEKILIRRQLEALSDDDSAWDGSTSHWFIAYSVDDSKVVVVMNFRNKTSSIYFKSKESAINAIKIIGEDRLKEYYLGVE